MTNCLYPFEPEYFKKEGLNAVFIGHPAADKPLLVVDREKVKRLYGLGPETNLVGLYPGSRTSEINRHLRPGLEALVRLREENPSCHFFISTFEKFCFSIQEAIDLPQFATLKGHCTLVTEDEEKVMLMSALEAAIAVNGTVGLELSLCQVPHISYYKTSGLTYFIAKRLVRLKHIHLLNIHADHGLLDGAVVPEYIQSEVHPYKMALATNALLEDPAERAVQMESFHAFRNILQAPAGKKSAERILDVLGMDAIEA